MSHTRRLTVLPALLTLALSACTQTAPAPAPAPAPQPAPVAAPVAQVAPVAAGQQMTPPNAEEAQCLEAVRKASGAARVVIISSDFAEDATTIVAGAGIPLVNWRCSFAGGALSGVAQE